MATGIIFDKRKEGILAATVAAALLKALIKLLIRALKGPYKAPIKPLKGSYKAIKAYFWDPIRSLERRRGKTQRRLG